jgi:hypothetical protein
MSRERGDDVSGGHSSISCTGDSSESVSMDV